MQQAWELAREAGLRDEVPVGAVLVWGETVLGRGANEREAQKRTVAHAEVQALEDYSRRTGQWRLPPETTLYVTVEPCLMCTGALLWARVDRIVYGCPDPRAAGLRTLEPLIEAGTYDHRFVEIQGGVLGEESARLMSDFFRAKRAARKSTDKQPILSTQD